MLPDSGDDPAADDVLLWRAPDSVPVRSHRVLIVDDYRDAADALRLLLEARGFECRIAVDPFAVCAIARDWQPFAVVLDIAMPGLDGLQLAARLRGDPHTGDMLLVACSGFASRRDCEAAKQAGFDAHCAKPLTPHRLLGYLDAASGREKPDGEVTRRL
ncbi:response regulator [Burkholderia contaminans]|uniref:response regulator n=1 Tax=Burkholderia contaminans TaxID=488447 RepID=UPI001CF5CEBB|nr:response regulator [Burkholderia contaminans]MCA7884989.1 response regulator [Burkholderia contaminans]